MFDKFIYFVTIPDRGQYNGVSVGFPASLRGNAVRSYSIKVFMWSFWRVIFSWWYSHWFGQSSLLGINLRCGANLCVETKSPWEILKFL